MFEVDLFVAIKIKDEEQTIILSDVHSLILLKKKYFILNTFKNSNEIMYV